MHGIFANRWWVVFASACGLMVGAGVINVFAMGVFLKPITEELGVGRGLFGTALWLNSSANALACFFIGWFIQRWGVRRVMIPGILLCALATASYGLIQASPFVLTYMLFAVGGFIAGCQTPIPYATATSQSFDRQRGLALGLAIAGVGIGTIVVPQIAGRLIAAFGWRLAFALELIQGQHRYADVRHPDLAVVQDIATQAGQGRFTDRTREHLGRSDTGIILWRKILTRELRALAEGRSAKAWARAPADIVPTLGF
jgi:MFS family permease